MFTFPFCVRKKKKRSKSFERVGTAWRVDKELTCPPGPTVGSVDDCKSTSKASRGGQHARGDKARGERIWHEFSQKSLENSCKSGNECYSKKRDAPVAQLDRASASGVEGREFESRRVYHFFCLFSEINLNSPSFTTFPPIPNYFGFPYDSSCFFMFRNIKGGKKVAKS